MISRVKLKYCFFCLIIFLSVSCGEAEEREIETISMDELTPKSERDYNYDELEGKAEEVEIETEPNAKLIQAAFNFSNVEKISTNAFPERFSYNYQKSWLFSNEEDTVKLSWWSYSDSTKTSSVLFNWLDCFPPSCNSIRLYDSVAPKNLEPSAVWVHDTLLIYLEGNVIPEIKKWQNTILQVFLEDKDSHFHFYPYRNKLIWERKKVR